jgi:NSS family neurotransmitter:Na+ symporter
MHLVGGNIIPEKELWNSRLAFVMAAIGSAVGLGNVWRFPYIAYTNGGGAFLIPYFVALFTAGIPMLILEFSLGHWSRQGAPGAFKKIGKKWEFVGWWSALVPFVIVTYYIVVMAWCFSYLIYSIDLRWGMNAEHFFRSDFLGTTTGPLDIGGISIPILLSLIVIWFLVFIILYKGVGRIGKVVMITVPLPWILLTILTLRGITLPGALEGISYYLTPNFSRLTDLNVWLAAYAQVFFSVGIAQGIMITYASHLHKKSDISNNAFIIALADAGTSFLAGFAVFSVIGYLAMSQGVGIENLGIAGPQLAFITYPTAISLFPVATAVFGILFYLALLTFGIDSAFSMIEPITAGIQHKWRMTKVKATALICLAGFFASLLFTTGSGLYWLDIVDHFVSNFGLVLVGLIECLVLGWTFRVAVFRENANKTSDILIGRWWDVLIKYVVPCILTILLIAAVYDNIIRPYVQPWWLVILGGGIPCIAIFIASFVFMKQNGKKQEIP